MLKLKLKASLLALSITLSVVSVPQTVLAKGESSSNREPGNIGPGIAPPTLSLSPGQRVGIRLLVTSPVWLTSQIVPVIYLARGEHMPLGWQIAGYVSSGLQLALGLTLPIESGLNERSSMGDDVLVGFVFLAVGAVSLALNIVAANANEPEPSEVAVSPVLLRDSRGNIAPGLGLSLLSF